MTRKLIKIDIPSYISFINSEKIDDFETTPPIDINGYISLLLKKDMLAMNLKLIFNIDPDLIF